MQENIVVKITTSLHFFGDGFQSEGQIKTSFSPHDYIYCPIGIQEKVRMSVKELENINF